MLVIILGTLLGWAMKRTGMSMYLIIRVFRYFRGSTAQLLHLWWLQAIQLRFNSMYCGPSPQLQQYQSYSPSISFSQKASPCISVVRFASRRPPPQNVAKGSVGCGRVIWSLVLSEASARVVGPGSGVVGIVASLEAPSAASALHLEQP